MVGTSVTYEWNATLAERTGNATLLQRVTKAAKAVAPGAGAVYPNESDPWVEEWEDEYWGDEYPKLVEIKKKYDKDGLLNCWKCVGFEEKGKGSGGSAFECWEAFEGLV